MEALRIAKAYSKSLVLIYLLLLTLSVIRSSCLPSHHWASQGFHFAGLNPISLVGLSGWPGEGRYPKHINWSLGFLRDQFLDPSSSPYTSLGPIIQAQGFSYHCYADDTQLYLSDDPTVAAQISGCLADISAWMKDHHLQLNLAKTELLVFPATSTIQHDFTIQLGFSSITPSTSDRNLDVIFDDQLTFKDPIAKTAWSCTFALHNIRKIRLFLTEHAAQLLVQALIISRLDYCNALLAGLPSSTIKPLQMSPKKPMLHLFLSPYTGYRLQLASSSRHWCMHIEQPQAQHTPTSTHYYESTFPPKVWAPLKSNTSWYHHREAQNRFPEHSRSPFLAGGMIFPTLSGMLNPLQFSSDRWKLISFNITWFYPKLKNYSFHF